ncbi:MAG TPA: methyltransferase domain-containing protein, partial [Armatimonadetes bacterium]|nr:methyltransferase domain-containing protein [Armatimonadota bacterium]
MSARTKIGWATTALVLASAALAATLRLGYGERKQARQILAATGVKGGLIVHLGCGDGRLTVALQANDSYLVHGLERDVRKVEQARKYIRSLGLYGKVSVDLWRGKHLPYTDNLVNLVVSEGPLEVPLEEVQRVLAPNGVAYVKEEGKWRKVVKPPPGEIDEWTHYLHDATNNAVAHDSVVGPPYHIQWVGGPRWTRSHDHLNSVSVVVSSGGRIFYIVDQGPTASVALPPRWFLVARDAFSGVILWERPLGPWEGHLRGFRSGPAGLARRLVAVNDRVYVTLGYGKPVSALDAATGATVKTYEGTDGAAEIVYDGGVLFVVAGSLDPKEAAAAKPFGPCPPVRRKRILAVKARTGELLWRKSDEETAEVMPTTLAVSKGRVFFQNPREVICLNAQTGRVLWRASRPVSLKRPAWSTPTLVVQGNVVLSADRAVLPQEQQSPGRVEWVVTSRGGEAPVGELIAFSAETGERLWACECREGYNAPVDVLVVNGLVWTGNLVRARDPGITKGRDLLTGEVKKQRPPDSKFYTVGMGHHRCYRNKATDRYILTNRAGVEFIDLETGRAIPNHWVRGTCQYGVIPCNGLLYAPPHSCACFIRAKLSGFYALAPKRKANSGMQGEPGGERLERGPAYEEVVAGVSGSEASQYDWPTYRHDSTRSGSTKSAVPATLKRTWQAEIGGKLSSPVVAGGKVFVASVETHTLYALDAETGRTLWLYTAGGRVDSPPTFYQGLVLFGSADGWVYCLRASDGELVWRFRAAPEDRRIVAYGQVESVWPVHGSVLVLDDVLYFAAGRSSYLDGGLYLYRLDPKTGKLLSETGINSRDPQTGEEPREVVRGVDMPGALPDVLSSDGTSIFMRHLRFDRRGAVQEPSVPHLYSPAGFLDDSWWHRTYWIIGTKMGCGWGGWPTMGNIIHSGRLLVFDDSTIYGFGRNRYGNGLHIGLGETHYRLFAARRELLPAAKAAPKPASQKKRRRGQAPVKSRVKYRWSRQIPLIVQAMVLADTTLFIAGPPDFSRGREEALAALEGKKGTLLWAVSTAEGKGLAAYRLDSPPVFDGLVAAQGR